MNPPSLRAQFEAFSALDADARALALAELERSDPERAARLRVMLDADAAQQTGEALPSIAVALSGSLLELQHAALRAIGFVPQRLLGRGGMGEVWLVERTVAGQSQKLALKLLQAGLGPDDAWLTRFRTEQRILLELDHPGIARLVDAGETDGHPWIAMEYIDGPDLLSFADREKLSVKARLKLFQQVCAAVQYANDRLIVHRDLKPANVLVDSRGQPKLLDFGIAKILGDSGAARLQLQTGTAQAMFSLYGVAPEQLRSRSATVATDVYALGALLYELVCGQRVYRSEGLGLGELEQQVLHQIPAPPSRRLPELSLEERRAVAAARGCASPEALTRELGDELDRITLHALRKLPSERYASARELAADVQRLLDEQPVLAVGQGRAYRLRKFLRRQRWAVAGVLLAIIATATFIVRLQSERNAAVKARNSAEQVSQFMVGLFKVADPESPQHDPDIKASELLVEALKRVEIDGLAADPEVGGPLLVALAQAANGLGNLEREKEILDAARKTLAGQTGPVVDELDVMEVERLMRTNMVPIQMPLLAQLEQRELSHGLRVRTILMRERFLLRASKPEEAKSYLEAARMRWHDRRIEERYASSLSRTGHDTEAQQIFAVLLEDVESRPDEHLERARLFELFGNHHERFGRYREAVAAFEHAITAARQRLESSHPRLLVLESTLASIHGNNGHRNLAAKINLRLLDQAYELRPESEPMMWTVLANVVRGIAATEDAGIELEEAALRAAGRVKPLGSRFPQWGYTMLATIRILDRQGRIQEALGLIDYALTPGPNKYELSRERRLSFEAWRDVLKGSLTPERARLWLQSDIPADAYVRTKLTEIAESNWGAPEQSVLKTKGKK